MSKRLILFVAVLTYAGVAAMLVDGPTVAASGAVPVESMPRRMPSANGVDEVLAWNQVFNDTVLGSVPAPNSLVTSRSAALVAAAVFDAVNGVDRRYKSIHVTNGAPSRTSARAAAIQASYAMLIRLYPTHAGPLTARRDMSIAVLGSGQPGESAQSIQRGMLWGQAVADSIWEARLTDGFTPVMAPFMGSATLGFWRPTPPANAPGSGPQFATMTPWILTRPSQFRPAPPPVLTSAEYAADYNETRIFGGATANSDVAVFWSGNGTLYWNRIATQLAAGRHRSLVENAHLFAVLHVAMADSSIAAWDAKYRYVFWRPVTAIRSLDDDGNQSTDPDPSWTPFLTTSAHPEYPSGHTTLAGAAATVLSAAFGDDAAFDASSETMPGTVRPFVGFSSVVEELANARVYGGMHFRTACVRGNVLGSTVAGYVLRHAMRPLHGGWDDGRDDDQQ